MSENPVDKKVSSVAAGSDTEVKTLMLQESLSDNTNGVVSMSYNDFIKYFLKVYVEKSKENPELRECRQEVLLHNQHVGEVMKRVDQLRAAMRVVLNQQESFSRTYNRDLQDYKRKGESCKDLKLLPKSTSEIGTQTQNSSCSIATNTDESSEKKTLECSMQTSPPSLSTSSTNTQTVLIKRRVRHFIRRTVPSTKSPRTTASHKIRLRKSVHSNGSLQNKVCESEPSKGSISNSNQPLTAFGENDSPSKIIRGNSLRKVFHGPGRLVKIIRHGCNPPGVIHDNASPKKVISGHGHLHNTSPKCGPSAIICHDSDGPFRKILRRRRDPLRVNQNDSPPCKKFRLTESSHKIDKNEINLNCVKKKEECNENSQTADSVSPQIGASSNSSETAAQPEIVSSDNTSQIASPSNDLPEAAIPKSNSFPVAVRNNLHIERSGGSSPQVAIRSRGPPQAAARTNCPLPQVTLRGRAPLQVAVRSKGPPQAPVQSNGLSQTGLRSDSPLEADRDGSPQTAVRSSGLPQKRAHASESPEPRTSRDSPQIGVHNNDPSETISEKNDCGINFEGSDTPRIKREIESPEITIADSDTSPTSIDGQTKTQNADLSKRSTSGKNRVETKESQDRKSSRTTSSSKETDVEVVDLVSDDDDEPPAPPPPVKGKGASPKKTIIVPIGSSSITPVRSVRPVSILPTLPPAVQLIPTTPTMSASLANGNLQVLRPMQALNRPMGPGLGSRVTYLVPSSYFPHVGSQPMTVYRTQTPGGIQNMVTLTPILPPGQPRARATLTKPGSSTNTS